MLFGNDKRYKRLAELPGVYTDNPENYFRDSADGYKLKLRTDRKPLPAAVPCGATAARGGDRGARSVVLGQHGASPARGETRAAAITARD